MFVRADTVASLHGVGKATVIKITKKGTFSLSKVGDVKADMKSVQAQATEFICAAYGKVKETCSTHDRMQGQDVAFKNREGWSIIGYTLVPSTNQ